LVFDSFNDAKFELAKLEKAREEIRRGLMDAPPQAKNFDELCDYWIENRAAHKRSGKDDESIIRKHLRPTFGKRAIALKLGIGSATMHRALRAHDEAAKLLS
jgi:DNA invertase Pin-like site-specific DNA recombinase